MRRRKTLETLGCVGVLLLGCGPSVSTDDPPPGGASSGMDPPSWPPPDCADSDNVFTDLACLEALGETCRAEETEAGCLGHENLDFAAETVSCGWARVVPLLDPETCAVGEPRGQCVATVESWDSVCVPEPECAAEPLGFGNWSYDIARQEFIYHCHGPFDEQSFVDTEPGSIRSLCSSNALPRPVDECSCAPAACVAIGRDPAAGGSSTGG